MNWQILHKTAPLLILCGLSLAATSTEYLTTYRSAKSTRVVFSRNFFYGNNNVNGMGCAGDAKIYFDPQLDRQAPTQPSWLRNISVDLTNSNAPFNSSNAFACSYGSSNSLSSDPACLGPTPPASCNTTPPPSNCAAFDDMQSLTGYQTKTFIIGGYNCENNAAGKNCGEAGRISPSIWQVTMNDTSGLASPSAAMSMRRTPLTLPKPNASHDATLPPAADTYPTTGPLLYAPWAYDEMHDWLISFGGLVMRSGTTPGFKLSSAIQRIYQKPYPQSAADPSSTGIEVIDVTSAADESLTNKLTPTSTTAGAAGFRTNATTITNDLIPPSARLGHTFTYIPRRTPSLARRWAQGTAGTSPCATTAGGTALKCLDTTTPTSETDSTSGWNDSDYFLMIGGITDQTSLSAGVAALMPHRLSKNDGTGVQFARDGMSWEWLSHFRSASTTPSIMPVVDLSTDGTSPGNTAAVWAHTARYTVRTDGVFPSRAFHRSVYDPIMNRVYIFGGLTTINTTFTNPTTSDYKGYGTVSALSDMKASTETWIYDLPHLGQKPTLACRVTKSPASNAALPGLFATLLGISAPGAHVSDFSTYDSDNLNYETSNAISPPGGCMQFAQPMTNTAATDTTADDDGTAQTYVQPPGRFEHAMAFDDAQGVAIMFGGCNTPPKYDSSNSLQGGSNPSTSGETTAILPYSPLSNCNSRTTLYNDTWMFIPPDTRESALVTSTAGATQYNVDRPDHLGLEPMLLGMPLYFSTSSSSTASTPSTAEILAHTNGTWIKLFSDDGSSSDSTTQPAARASASFWYDKSHQKFYLFGGKVCNGTCEYRNDLWEFTPPRASQCTRYWTNATSEVTCTTTGSWRRIDNSPTALYSTDPSHSSNAWPATTTLATAVYATRPPGDYNHYGDGYYTVSDSACGGQGPIIGTEATSKQQVGAIYVDIDRSQFSSTENLLINIKLLPFAGTTFSTAGADNNDGTKLPGYHFSGTFGSTTTDDRDAATSSDSAYIRVSLMVNPYSSIDNILRQSQPRYHSYQEPGAPIVAEEFDLAANGTGMPSEKQVFVPLSLDSRINMIKIERVRGSVKFYDMTVSKF